MIFIWGSRLYGRTEVVPGLWHVATRFGHLWFIPLFPVSGSYAVLDKERGVPIPMSGRSVMATYIRGWGVPFILAAGLIGLGGAGAQNWAGTAGGFLAAAAMIALIVWSYTGDWWMKCSPDRAREIAKLLGLGDEGHIFVEFATGQIDKATFDKAMADVAKDRDELVELVESEPLEPPETTPPTAPTPRANIRTK